MILPFVCLADAAAWVWLVCGVITVAVLVELVAVCVSYREPENLP